MVSMDMGRCTDKDKVRDRRELWHREDWKDSEIRGTTRYGEGDSSIQVSGRTSYGTVVQRGE
jgi:hypothetical protein